MLDMCKYNMASQHDSTTQVFYSIGSEERDITIMGLMTQHSEHTNNKHMWKLNMSEYIHLQMKKAEEPDYLADPAEGTRSSIAWKPETSVASLLVQEERSDANLARMKCLCKNIN